MKALSARTVTCAAVVLGIVLGLLASPLRAEQIASNINGVDIGLWGINSTFWSGVPFTTDSRPWTVDSVVAPVAQGTGRSMSGIFIQVYSNNAGRPGSPLGSQMHTPTITDVTTNQTFTRIADGAVLAPNTLYWMVLGVDDPVSNANPIYRRTTDTPGAGPGSMGLSIYSTSNGGSAWSFQSAANEFQSIRMQINGTVVPEPTAALACAVAGIVTLARRRPRA